MVNTNNNTQSQKDNADVKEQIQKSLNKKLCYSSTWSKNVTLEFTSFPNYVDMYIKLENYGVGKCILDDLMNFSSDYEFVNLETLDGNILKLLFVQKNRRAEIENEVAKK